MGQHLTCHIVLNALVPLHDLGVLSFLVVEHITFTVTLNFSGLIHNGKTVGDFLQQFLVCRHIRQHLGKHRHKCRRRKINLSRYCITQGGDNGFIDGLVVLISLQLFQLFPCKFLGVFQLIYLCLVIQ